MAITAAVHAIGWLVGSVVLAAAQPAAVAAQPVAATVSIPLVNRAQLETAGLTLYWQRALDLGKGERISRLSRIEENLYLITNLDRVLTLDAATGVFRWDATIAQPDIRLQGPTHGPDVVYFANILSIQAFDRINGERTMKWKEGITPASPVVSDGQSLYFGTTDGRVVNMRLRDMLMTWQFASAGMVTARPMLLGPNLYVISQAGHLYALTKADKTRLWEAQTTGPVQSTPAIYGSHLYVSSLDQSMWCFDLVTGRTLWRTRLSAPLMEDPKATAKHVYLPVAKHGLYSFNPDSGNIDWHREDGQGFLAEHQNQVWLISGRASLLGCDKSSGEVRREVPCSADLWVSNQDDDAIWLATTEGQVVCVRPQGAGFLRYRSAREAAGRNTPPSTRPASRPADQDFVPEPATKPPVDRLRRSDAIPPVGGNTSATQPAQP